jgi:putative ABC transport system permease protein
MKLYRIAARNIRRNRRRSVLSCAAIAAAVMGIVFFSSYLKGMWGDLEKNLITYYSGEIRVQHADYERYNYLNPLHLRIEGYRELIREIEAHEAVALLSPRIGFPAAVYRDEETYHAWGVGVDFDREREFQNLDAYLAEGRIPYEGRNEALLGIGLAKEIGVGTGDKITVMTTTMRRGTNAVTFLVTGLVRLPVQQLNGSWILAPLDRVQRLLRMGDSVSEILIKLKEGVSVEETARELEAGLGTEQTRELSIKTWQEGSTSYGFIKMAGMVYNFISLFFFVLASSVIVNTTMMVVFERVREIGTIGALGMTRGEIVRLFFLEALYLGVIGSGIGVALGIGITVPLSFTGIDLSSALQGVSFEVSNRIYPSINPGLTALAFIYSVAVAGLTSLIPSTRAARIEPVEALRSI